MTGRAPLALICGAGQFPLALAQAAEKSGRRVFLIGIRGAADPAIERYPHAWVGMGRLGRLLKLARDSGAREIVFVGGVPRPAWTLDFIPDLRALKLMARGVGTGDNRMLTLLTGEIEREGFTVRGVQDIAPGLMMPAGMLGCHQPAGEALAASKLGFDVLSALGPYDIGQGAVVADKRVVAIEAAEGTDEMLARVAGLRAAGKLKTDAARCVFVKTPKRGQDLRLDTPAVGLETVMRTKQAGLAGIAVAAGQVMTTDLVALIAAADEAGIFVLGVEQPQ